MALLTRIAVGGAGRSYLPISDKEESGEVEAPDTPHGSASGWQLPYYEEEKPKLKVVQAPLSEVSAAPERQEVIQAKKPALKLVERDKTLDQDMARLIEAEIKALEAAIESDKIEAARIAQADAEAAMVLKLQQEEEELMLMLLLSTA